MTEDAYLPAALAKRIAQARERIKDEEATTNSDWTTELLGHLADEAERAQKMLLSLTGEVPLPRDEDGHILTSAEYGECWVAKIEYNTDFDGSEVDPGEPVHPETLHGPFTSQQECADWLNAYPDGDTDVHDMTVLNMNRVRPA